MRKSSARADEPRPPPYADKKRSAGRAPPPRPSAGAAARHLHVAFATAGAGRLLPATRRAAVDLPASAAGTNLRRVLAGTRRRTRAPGLRRSIRRTRGPSAARAAHVAGTAGARL